MAQETAKVEPYRVQSRFRLKYLTPYVLILPALVFVALLGYAVIGAFWDSLHEYGIFQIVPKWVGIQNYANLLDNPRFVNSFRISAIFWAGSVTLGIVISMSYALCLFKIVRARRFFRAVSLVPFLISGVAAGVSWRFLWNGELGLINNAMSSIGFSGLNWLGDATGALIVVILANVWFVAPFPTLLLLAGLQTIDTELFDVAAVDGASPWATLRHIILPTIKPMVGVTLVWLTYASFSMFDIVLPLTAGGPGRSTELVAVFMYDLAFKQLAISDASAVLILVLSVNVLLSAILVRAFRM